MKLFRIIFMISVITTLVLGAFLYHISNSYSNNLPVYPKHIHKTLLVDNHFNDEETKIISQAAQEWTDKTHHIATFEVQKLPIHRLLNVKHDVLVVPVTEYFPDIVESDQLFNFHNTLGCINNTGTINTIELVQERIGDQEYKTVVLHEIGHILGLTHTDLIEGLGTLMYPAIKGGSDHITNDDIKQFCVLYQCDPNQLKN